MKGRTNCGFSGGGNVKYIPACATLTILVPTDATVQVSNGTISQILDDTYKTNIVDIYNIYNYYIKPSQFGGWTITTTFDDISKITTVVVDETVEYKINTILPSTYQQVTYIGGSTTEKDTAERINTGTIPNSKTCISSHYLFLSNNTTDQFAWRHFFGVLHGDGNTDSFKFQQYYGTLTGQVDLNENYFEMSPTALTSGFHYIKIDLKHGIIINDNTTISFSIDNFECSNPIGIIRPQYNATTAYSYKHEAKTQDFKIYDDDVLIQYFIPCYRISDSIIGMYEIINNQFYVSAGTTGGFTKGPDLTF